MEKWDVLGSQAEDDNAMELERRQWPLSPWEGGWPLLCIFLVSGVIDSSLIQSLQQLSQVGIPPLTLPWRKQVQRSALERPPQWFKVTSQECHLQPTCSDSLGRITSQVASSALPVPSLCSRKSGEAVELLVMKGLEMLTQRSTISWVPFYGFQVSFTW